MLGASASNQEHIAFYEEVSSELKVLNEDYNIALDNYNLVKKDSFILSQ